MSIASVLFATALLGSLSEKANPLLAAAKNHSLSMGAVADARFDPSREAEFKRFSGTVLKPPVPPTGQWLGCDYANQWALPHAMLAAAQAATTHGEAIALWSEAERVRVIGSRLLDQAPERGWERRPTALGRELAHRVVRDQAWREAMTESPHSVAQQEVINWSLMPEFCAVDRENTKYVSELISSDNWPRISIDGKRATADAWLLVQHADDDPVLQRTALSRMYGLLLRKEVSGDNYAYLYDRVLVHEDRPQSFGTQFTTTADGCLRPSTISDPEKVDARRKSVSLPSLKAYARELASVYHQPLCAPARTHDGS